ncbi:MAG TPA: DUF1579 family protein [Candidatus Acidoferrales bacterium]
MRIVYGCLLCLFLWASISSAFTQESKPLSAIPPDGFQFAGTWDCEGTFRNAQVHKATFTGTTILGGKWLELTEQDIQPATGYLAKYLIGFDPQQKRLVEFDANNFGAAIYTSEDGWQDRVLTMTSSLSQDAKAPYAANRFRYYITAPDTFTVDWQISKTAELKWIEADHLACKRRGNN